jgi:hypothetical protein
MPSEQLTIVAEYRRKSESQWYVEEPSAPPRGLAGLHARWQAVIDYCRDHAGEDCRTILRIMGESGRFD